MSDLSDLGDTPTRGLDPVETVRRRPERYFRHRRFDTEEFIALLAREIADSGVPNLTISRAEGWITVEAKRDWLGGDNSAFYAPVRFPEGGRNVTRVEVLLTAFCEGVVTVARLADTIKESPVPPPASLLRSVAGRSVSFLPPVDQPGRAEEGMPSDWPARPEGRGERELRLAIDSYLEKVSADGR